MGKRLSAFEDFWVNRRNFRYAKKNQAGNSANNAQKCRIPQITPYASFASSSELYLQLRVLLEKDKQRPNILRRGLPTLFAKQAPSCLITVTIPNGERFDLMTDRGGYITQRIPLSEGQMLEPGWQTLTLKLSEAYSVKKGNKVRTFPENDHIYDIKVYVVSNEQKIGIISDIDDTILISNAPRPLVALKNMIIVSPHKRHHVHSMPILYNKFEKLFPNSFLLYLSAGPWNQYPFLKRFMATHKFPFAPIILQDIGPDEDKIFESTKVHKGKYLHMLFEMFPNVKWVLIGDDGQHDLTLYRQIALENPQNVEAIVIRQLSAPEHILTNALPFAVSNAFSNIMPNSAQTQVVPIFFAPDGDGLLALLNKYRPVIVQ